MLRAALLPLLLFFAACSAAPPPPPAAPVDDLAGRCSEPRPQVCTMEYDPVCGELQSGSRSDYSSPCNACAHDEVVSYLKGACGQVQAATSAASG
ncbi:hypothetical protein [Parahaliea aestuarii]|uniref:Kazal-like domain-containing protein n=1 Tax=Parahaliea aestuarii TaxID=1852021 RepID=A0A5C8ZKY0_9GAMM|nr:hypothetical protein [Parahaliea aestuarii]TXS89098.1 hypothetical protein FVW59_18400 [Parahaliea aestuarii]